jgi:CHAT domain-containing protein/tetratricopeptide (TPR) repeat protein
MIARVLVVLGVLGGLAGTAQGAAPPARMSAEQAERWERRNRLLRRANALVRAGQTGEANASVRRALALERGLLGDLSGNGLVWLVWLAEKQQEREQFAGALASRRELLTLLRDRHGRGDWRVRDARLDLDDALLLARLDSEQRQRLRQAGQWNEQVFRLWRQGRSQEALPLAKKALQARRQILGEKHRHTALSWFNLGAQHEAVHHVEPARLCTRHALRIYKEALGEGHPDYATGLNNLASLYQAMGEHRLALPLHQQALRISKEALGEGHPAYAQSLNNLAGLYQDMGEHRLALPLFQQALRIRQEALGEKHPLYANSLSNLAGVYQDMGEYRQALPLVQQALRLHKEALGERHPSSATSLNNLASLYQAMGEHRLALPLHQQALQLRKEVLGEKHPHYAVSLNNLALLYHEMGEHRLALPLYRQALRLRKEALGERHPHYGQSLNSLAVQYQAVGKHRQALPLYQQALRVYKEALGEKHLDYATSLNHLALLYHVRGKQGACLALAGQALAVLQTFVHDSLPVLSDRQRRQLLEQRAASLEFFLSAALGAAPPALVYERVAAFKDVTSAAAAEQHLARRQRRLRPLLGELRDVRSQLARLGRQADSSTDLARWRRRFDELDRRKTDLEQRLARASPAFSHLHEKPTAWRVAARLPGRTALVEFLVYLHYLRPGVRGWQGERRLLALVVRRDREVVLVRLGKADRLHSAVRLWRQTAKAGASPDPLAARLLRQRLWQPIAKHLDGIDTVLIAPDGELAGLPFAALPGDKPGSFLLESYTFGYLSGGRRLLLPAPEDEGDGLLVLGGTDYGKPRATTDRLVRPRHWPSLPGADLEARQVEAAFRARFAKGRVEVLSGKRASRGGLLAALEGKGKRRWRYLHLATHGHFEAPRDALPPAVLGAWGVGAAAAGGLAGLSGSLLGALAAQEPGVLNEERGFDPSGRRYRVDEGNPMLLASLVLAGVNDKGEEGYLSAEEIALQDLTGCELAVLSACETALGRQAGWQGVQGLQRGFHQAGARHVLASLWSVSDPATSVLMERFYRRLWEKQESPMQALREAQLFVLKNPGRVLARAGELRKDLLERGVAEEALAARGIGKRSATLPAGAAGKRSPVAWWAPWVLSGVPAR